MRAGSGVAWQHLRTIATQRRAQVPGRDVGWYRFGGALLLVESEDDGFSSRLRDIYAECAFERPGAGACLRSRYG